MTSPARIPIFDGHNDALLRLLRRGGDGPGAFLDGEEKGHLDLPKAIQGGFAGGLFAVFVPSARRSEPPPDEATAANPEPPPASPIDLASAQSVAISMISLLLRIGAESQGRVRLCRDVGEIRQCMKDGVLAAVLHMEGAEAIDPKFEFLDVLHAATCRWPEVAWPGLEPT